MKKVLSFLMILCGFSAFAQTANTAVVQNYSAVRFKAVIEKDKEAVILDLRTPEEIAKGHIEGAVFIDWLSKDGEKKIAALDKNKTYYVYCAAGGRSGDAAEYMEKLGFKKVGNLEKGFDDWAKKGFPVAKK
jgi:rhodanese-related sulfurtransferase